MKRRKWIVIVIVLLLAGAGLAWMKMRVGKGAQGPKGEIVRLEEVARGELVEFVNAPGEVEPRTKVEISARISARIAQLPFKEGQHVTKGGAEGDKTVDASVLVRLDATDLEAALRRAEASRAAQAAGIDVEKLQIESRKARLVGSESTLAKTKLDVDRCEKLLETGDASQSERDEICDRYEQLKAEFEAAKHSLAAARMNLVVAEHRLRAADADIEKALDELSYTVITSPIDGVVTRVNAEVGELAVTGTMNSPGTIIMEVADLSEMLLVVEVDESDVGSVRKGQEAVVRIHTYPDEEFAGVVESVALTHNQGFRGKYFKTEISLDTMGKQVFSGLTTDVDIMTRKYEGVIKVPSQAALACKVDDLPLDIRENSKAVDLNKAYATVVYRFIDGKAVVTPVIAGASDMTHTIIEEGLSEGDVVIVGPYKVLEGLAHDKAVRDERVVEAEKKTEEEAAAEQKTEEEAAKPGDDGGSGGQEKEEKS